MSIITNANALQITRAAPRPAIYSTGRSLPCFQNYQMRRGITIDRSHTTATVRLYQETGQEIVIIP